jgi:hypothetical protein
VQKFRRPTGFFRHSAKIEIQYRRAKRLRSAHFSKRKILKILYIFIWLLVFPVDFPCCCGAGPGPEALVIFPCFGA